MTENNSCENCYGTGKEYPAIDETFNCPICDGTGEIFINTFEIIIETNKKINSDEIAYIEHNLNESLDIFYNNDYYTFSINEMNIKHLK